jgi:hypothetical protein
MQIYPVPTIYAESKHSDSRIPPNYLSQDPVQLQTIETDKVDQEFSGEIRP